MDLPESSKPLLQSFLKSSLRLDDGTNRNLISNAVPSSLETFFADRYIENTIPIFINKNKILIIGLYCMNIDKLRVYPKIKPILMLDFRYWEVSNLGQIIPTKQGLMIPLNAIKEITKRLYMLESKYSLIKTLDELQQLFDPYNIDL